MNYLKITLLLSLITVSAQAMLAPLARTTTRAQSNPAFTSLVRHMTTQSSDNKMEETTKNAPQKECTSTADDLKKILLHQKALARIIQAESKSIRVVGNLNKNMCGLGTIAILHFTATKLGNFSNADTFIVLSTIGFCTIIPTLSFFWAEDKQIQELYKEFEKLDKTIKPESEKEQSQSKGSQ